MSSLKDLLAAVVAKPGRMSTAGAIAHLLTPHLQPSDLDWAIDVFVNLSCSESRFGLSTLFGPFAPEQVRRRLAAQKLHGGTKARDVKSAIALAEWRERAEVKPEKTPRRTRKI